MSRKQFGGKFTSEWERVYEQSPNWKDGRFVNLTGITAGGNWRRMPEIICKQIRGHSESSPKKPLPILPLDRETFLHGDGGIRFVWYGHSVVLLRINGKTVLVDPMFGNDTAPIAPTKNRRFSTDALALIDALPPIDFVLLTHDHYDHLDYSSFKKLKGRVGAFHVALGNKRHLLAWGIEDDRIREFDWWQSLETDGLRFTFTPTQHFSGRGINSIAKSLWGGWAIRSDSHNIWFSGDSGYIPHFVEIGSRLGPFDLAFMECGQYCVDWPEVHMFPEQSVQAAVDAGASRVVPVHWGAFNLSYEHAWYEPGMKFAEACDRVGLPYGLPRLGEVVEFGDSMPRSAWWDAFR